MRDFLFDFVDFRNYKAIQHSERNRYYISLTPEETNSSVFFSNLSSQTYRELRFEMRSRQSTFTGRLRRFDIEVEFGDFLEFYQEINKEQYRQGYATLSSITDDLALPLRLNSTQIIRLWDNFALYLFIHPDEAMVDLISNVFIANLFFDRYMEFQRDEDLTDNENAQLKRIARFAKVLIDIPIARPSNTLTNTTGSLNINQQKLLSEAHTNILNRRRKTTLTALSAKLKQNHIRLLRESETQIAQSRDENISSVTTRLEELNLDTCNEEIPNLINNLQPNEEVTITREALMTTLDPNELVLINEIDSDEDDVSILTTKIETSSNTIPRVRKIKTQSRNRVQVGDALVTMEEQLPDQSWMLKIEERSDGASDIFLTYYHANNVDLMLDTITGSIRAGNTVVEFNAQAVEENEEGFQQFHLTSSPISITNENRVGSVSLTATRLVSGEALAQPTFRTLLTRPFFGALTIPQDEPVETLALKTHFGIDNIKVADFRRVEQEICCYKAGEVSHIENILASEYKERSSRKLVSTQVETETTEEFTSENASDTETTDKLEMQSEASQTISEEQSSAFNINTSASGQVGPASFTLGTSADFSQSISQEQSNSQALNYSKGITQKISKKIIEKRTRKRRTLMIKEFENITKHGFDNREGDQHVVGVYRWVNKIYKNTLINYGKRLTVDFFVPEPGIHHIWSEFFKTAAAVGAQKKLMEPVAPPTLGLESPLDITKDSYMEFAGAYGADVSKIPSEVVNVARSFSNEIREEGGVNTDHGISHNDFELPEGYIAVSAKVRGGFDQHGKKNNKTFIRISIGRGSMAFDKKSPWGSYYIINEEEFGVRGIEGILPVTINSNDVGIYAFVVTVNCELKDEFFKRWQLDTYNRIIEAYQDQLAEYENALEMQEGNPNKRRRRSNPLKNKEIIKRDLKLSCINMLTVPFGIGISEQHYLVDHLPPHIIQGPKLEEHGRLIKFLENAIEWELMAYTLYPYYYNHEKLWFWKMNIEGGNDPLFENFLRSGMAELRVPIRKGYENAFLYFIETGEVWQAPKFVLGFANHAHVSIDNELATAENEITIEETWKTKIPTSLTILQRNAGGLDETGLPCHEEDEVIAAGPSLLTGGIPSTNGN